MNINCFHKCSIHHH